MVTQLLLHLMLLTLLLDRQLVSMVEAGHGNRLG